MSDPNLKFERDEDLFDFFYRKYVRRGARISLWRLWLRFMVKKTMWIVVIEGSRGIKRIIDIIVSTLGLIIFSPIFGLTALLIKLEDRGPVFFAQERIGKWGKPFTMYKFRSMIIGADDVKDELLEKNEAGGVIFKMKRDPRITEVGYVLRRFSLDELPQLYNVLKGDMSLVGPRPHPTSEVADYSLSDRRRLQVIPGITGLWQVSGRSNLPFEKQVALDIQYIESQSLWGDIVLLLKTIPVVLLGRGAY